jgi:hypothetical protein
VNFFFIPNSFPNALFYQKNCIRNGLGIGVQVIIAVSIFLDLIFGIPLIVIFGVVLKIANIPNPAKRAIVYVVTAKLFIGVLPMLTFFLFILTEMYVFAILRGVIFGGLFTYILGAAAFIFSKNVKQFLIIVASSFLLLAGSFFIYSIISSKINIIENQIDILEDPIGQEFVDYQKNDEGILKMGVEEDIKKIIDFINKNERREYQQYYQMRDGLTVECYKDIRSIKEFEEELSKKDFKFETNKEIFKLLKKYITSISKAKNTFYNLLYCSPLQPEFDKKVKEVDQLMLTQLILLRLSLFRVKLSAWNLSIFIIRR